MADPVRDFLQDPVTGGMAVVGGDFALVSGKAAVPQGIGIRLRTILGEVWVNEAEGVDYKGSILIRGADPLLVRALLTEQIAAVPDVTSVVGAQLVGPDADRVASIDFQAGTIYSAQPVVGLVEAP